MFVEMNSQLLNRLRERRKSLGLTQKELSRFSGVSIHAISDIESGKANPTLETLNAIADTLGLEITAQIK